MTRMSRNPLLVELDGMSTRELYKKGKAMRDASIKRYRRLKENVESNPLEYSPHALKVMEKDGIPMISTSMGRQELKTKVLMLDNLMGMKTGTSRGAKRHQREVIRSIADVPYNGYLTKDEQKRLDEYESYLKQDKDALSNFWKAYEHHKHERRYAMLDSHQILEEFREIYKNMRMSGLQTPNEFFGEIELIVKEQYDKDEQSSLMSSMGMQGGMFR